MSLIRHLREPVVARLRRAPFAQRLHARWRRARHERAVAGFIGRRDGRAPRLPEAVVYEATMRCNLRCGFCYVGELLNIEGQWREELPVGDLGQGLPSAPGLHVSLTGGEIFARKDITELLQLLRAKGYVCRYLTTNGTLIDEPRARELAELARQGFLEHVSVSIDGPPDLHDSARGMKGAFARTAAGLERLQRATAAAGARLRVSLNTTISPESLASLDRMAEVAGELNVDAIGINHLMFATPGEVARTIEMLGAPDASAIATFVTEDARVPAPELRSRMRALAADCSARQIRFDVRPKVHDAILERYYTAGEPLEGRCLYPFQHARVGFSGKVYFCPFIRVEVGDLTRSSLEEIWNGPAYIALRRRLLEERLFPVCRRCCKVELARPS